MWGADFDACDDLFCGLWRTTYDFGDSAIFQLHLRCMCYLCYLLVGSEKIYPLVINIAMENHHF